MFLKLSSFLSLVLLCTGYALPPKSIYKYLDCDDPDALQAALVAVGNINLNHKHGYKYAFNRLERVKVLTVKPGEEIFFLELDLLETKCPSVSPYPVENCPVRPAREQAVDGDCDSKVLKQNGSFTALGERCKSELDSAENGYDVCPKCSLLAQLNDTKVIHAVDVSLANFNSGNNTVFYQLHEIGRAQIQNAHTNRVNTEFVIAATNCSIEEANSGLSTCVVQSEPATRYAGCVSSVEKPVDATDEVVKVQCAIYDPQVLFSRADRKPSQEPQLTSIPCNDPAAEAAADLSLHQLNGKRREGAVFGLKRISSAHKQFEESTGTVYYLTLDVLETECHVLSRKKWKNCEPKPQSEAVFGTCKIVFHLSKPQKIAQLYTYDCTLKPLARFPGGCPGCHIPVSIPLNDSTFQNIANLAIEKFNQKSNYYKYFTIGNITKATAQVIAGTAYYLEFTIQETTCNKSLSAEELALCAPLDCEFAHSGYCKSRSLAHWSRPDDPYVSVTCKIFEPEASIIEEQKHNLGHDEQASTPGARRESRKKKEKRREKHGLDNEHDDNLNGSHEHDHQHLHPFEHHHILLGQSHTSDSVKPVGKITYEGTEEESEETKGRKNRGNAKSKEDKKRDAKADRTPPNAFGRQPKPIIHPFPDLASASAQCPGPVREYVPPVAPEDSTALPY